MQGDPDFNCSVDDLHATRTMFDIVPWLEKTETMQQDSCKEQASSFFAQEVTDDVGIVCKVHVTNSIGEASASSAKAPCIKQKRKQNRMAMAVLRAKTVWTTMARRKLHFDSAIMHGNAYVQF